MGNPQLQDPTAAAPPACKERGLLEGAGAPAAPCRQARGHIASLKMEKKKSSSNGCSAAAGLREPLTASTHSLRALCCSHTPLPPQPLARSQGWRCHPAAEPTNPGGQRAANPQVWGAPTPLPCWSPAGWGGGAKGAALWVPPHRDQQRSQRCWGGPALQPFPPTPSSTKPHLPVGLPCCHGPPTSATLLPPLPVVPLWLLIAANWLGGSPPTNCC